MPANFRLRHTATITAAIAGALVAGSSVSMASTPKADDVLFQHEVGQMLANMDIRIGNIALAEIEHVAAREAEALDRDGLLAQGTLTRTRPTLSKIAVIGLKDGRLAINRNAWEAAAKADEPEQAQGAAQQIQLGGAGGGAIQIRGRVQIAGMDVNDPLTRLWNELRTQAGAGSSGTSISGDRRTLTFDGPALSGRLITTSQTFNLLLIEDSGIGRTLQISEASPNRLRINVLAANGDLLTLNQRAEGELHLMMIEGTNVRQARGESFIELYLTDPKWFDEKVLPTFAGLGITMPHGPLSEPMRDAVLDSLRPREGSVADQARELFEGLESETFATREAATQKLTDEFSAFEELIRAELAREGISTERRARLEQVVAESGTAAPSPAQDARNLGLLDNITYLKHLADHPELSDDDRKTIRQRISALEER